jgi:hypothetical protein
MVVYLRAAKLQVNVDQGRGAHHETKQIHVRHPDERVQRWPARIVGNLLGSSRTSGSKEKPRRSGASS